MSKSTNFLSLLKCLSPQIFKFVKMSKSTKCTCVITMYEYMYVYDNDMNVACC